MGDMPHRTTTWLVVVVVVLVVVVLLVVVVVMVAVVCGSGRVEWGEVGGQVVIFQDFGSVFLIICVEGDLLARESMQTRDHSLCLRNLSRGLRLQLRLQQVTTNAWTASKNALDACLQRLFNVCYLAAHIASHLDYLLLQIFDTL